MKISKDKLLNKTTSHEPEFIEALELLVDDINANKEINNVWHYCFYASIT